MITQITAFRIRRCNLSNWDDNILSAALMEKKLR